MSDQLDNAAAAALWKFLQAPKENMGALYRDGEGIAATPTVTGNGEHVKGKLSVPAGSLAALFHNHPQEPRGRDRMTDPAAEHFSPDDIAQARRVGVPSYIQTPTNALRRFDPSTGKTEDVLAEMPIDQIRSLYLRNVLERAP